MFLLCSVIILWRLTRIGLNLLIWRRLKGLAWSRYVDISRHVGYGWWILLGLVYQNWLFIKSHLLNVLRYTGDPSMKILLLAMYFFMTNILKTFCEHISSRNWVTKVLEFSLLISKWYNIWRTSISQKLLIKFDILIHLIM